MPTDRTTKLRERLFEKAILTAADMKRLLNVSTPTVQVIIDQGDIPVLQLGRHPRYSAEALAKWLGVEPDHDARTPASTSSGEPGISSCVKTKGGKPIHAGKPYRYAGRVYDGADIIAIAQLLGVA